MIVPEIKPDAPRNGDLGFTFCEGKWTVFTARVTTHTIYQRAPSCLWVPPTEPEKVTSVSWIKDRVLMPDGRAFEVEQKC